MRSIPSLPICKQQQQEQYSFTPGIWSVGAPHTVDCATSSRVHKPHLCTFFCSGYCYRARVDEIIDLRTCVDGAEVAIRNEQYEDAAQHIHRFLRFDQSKLAEHTKYLLNEGTIPKKLITLDII